MLTGGKSITKQSIMEKYSNKGITPRMKYARNDRTNTYKGIADVLIRDSYGKDYADGMCLFQCFHYMRHWTKKTY